MTVKDEPRNQIPTAPQGINQRLDHWIDNSAPGWFRYLVRYEWHQKPETRTEAIMEIGLCIIIALAALTLSFFI